MQRTFMQEFTCFCTFRHPFAISHTSSINASVRFPAQTKKTCIVLNFTLGLEETEYTFMQTLTCYKTMSCSEKIFSTSLHVCVLFHACFQAAGGKVLYM